MVLDMTRSILNPPMNPFPVTVVAAFFLITSPLLHAAKKKRGDRAAAPTASADALAPKGNSPSEKLAPYIQHAEQMLALQRPAAFEQASGQIALLKQSFVAERAAAGGAAPSSLNAAIATCEAIAAALDERQRTLSQIKASAAVKGDSDLGERRKDNLTQGLRGRNKAKSAKLEFKREKREAAEARREAAEGDDALTAGSVQRWNQRAIELRKQIVAAYGRISQT